MNETGPAIEAIEVARSFGGVRALTAGNLSAQFGEVHGSSARTARARAR